MKLLINILFTTLFVYCFYFNTFIHAADADGRFTIIEAGERAYLLDTRTGSTWRYFFNNIGEQGWMRTYIVELYSDNDVYIASPYGDPITVPHKDK